MFLHDLAAGVDATEIVDQSIPDEIMSGNPGLGQTLAIEMMISPIAVGLVLDRVAQLALSNPRTIGIDD